MVGALPGDRAAARDRTLQRHDHRDHRPFIFADSGAIAQLGRGLRGMQEVGGSIPPGTILSATAKESAIRRTQ